MKNIIFWLRVAIHSKAIFRQLESLTKLLQHCEVSTGVCCCGGDMDKHSYYDNHSPTDMGAYEAERRMKEATKLINSLQ